jgi:biopolymer transport protein ExbB
VKLALIVFTALAIPVIASAANIDEAVLKTQQDIKAALNELNTLRSDIEKECAPLAAEHRHLSAEVAKKREIVSRTAAAEKYGEEQQRRLASEVQQLENESAFVLSTLAEYRRGMETRISAAALQSCRKQLDVCDNALHKNDLTKLGETAKAVLSPAINRINIGGFRTKGSALSAAGIEQQGVFIFMGPLAYFSSSNNGSGIVISSPGNLLPSYFDKHSKQQQQAIARLVAGKTAEVPVDISSGDALRIKTAEKSFTANIRKGGFVMIPLLLIGLTAIILTILKTINMHSMRSADPQAIDAVIDELNTNGISAAEKSAQTLPPLTASLIKEALTYRKSPREHLEEILHEHILAMMPKLESHLGTLAVMGAVAPLLGLLGTVTGMMHTFDLVTIFGTGEARLLSGGISEALITTKFGLGIAIPVLLVHAFLARRIRTVVADLENTAVHFVNVLKRV